VLDGAARTVVSVTNSGGQSVKIDVTLGNYAIDPDGDVLVDPALPPARSAKAWLRVQPARIELAPGRSAQITITSRPTRSSAPGDHHALLLFSTVPPTSRGIAIRTRVGVTVLVRVNGPFARHLQPLGLSVARDGAARVVRLRLANRGNVNERLASTQTLLELRQNHRVIARLHATTRSILPGTTAYLNFVYRGKPHGLTSAIVHVAPTPARQAGPGLTYTPPTIVVRAQVQL
jgi:hypothetical protein